VLKRTVGRFILPSQCPVGPTTINSGRYRAEKWPGHWRVVTAEGDALLGTIDWCDVCEAFVFKPGVSVELSGDCLVSIAGFLTRIEARREVTDAQ